MTDTVIGISWTTIELPPDRSTHSVAASGTGLAYDSTISIYETIDITTVVTAIATGVANDSTVLSVANHFEITTVATAAATGEAFEPANILYEWPPALAGSADATGVADDPGVLSVENDFDITTVVVANAAGAAFDTTVTSSASPDAVTATAEGVTNDAFVTIFGETSIAQAVLAEAVGVAEDAAPTATGEDAFADAVTAEAAGPAWDAFVSITGETAIAQAVPTVGAGVANDATAVVSADEAPAASAAAAGVGLLAFVSITGEFTIAQAASTAATGTANDAAAVVTADQAPAADAAAGSIAWDAFCTVSGLSVNVPAIPTNATGAAADATAIITAADAFPVPIAATGSALLAFVTISGETRLAPATPTAATGVGNDATVLIIGDHQIADAVTATATGAGLNCTAVITAQNVFPTTTAATGVGNDPTVILETRPNAVRADATGAGNSATVSVTSNTTPPTVTSPGSTFTAGTVWTSTSGTWWDPAATFAYQWQQSATQNGTYANAAASDPGGNVTTASYAPPVANAGTWYRSRVTATGSGGSALAYSQAFASVSSTPAPVNTVAPVLASPGNTWEATTIWTCTQGTWTNASTFVYLWQQSATQNGTYVTAATSAVGGSVNVSSYAPPSADAGNWYRCRVTATGAGGSTAGFSNVHQSVVVTTPPANTAVPVVSSPGSSWNVTDAWTTTNGTWTNATSFAYQWQQSTTLNGTYAVAATSAAGGNLTTATYAPPTAGVGNFYRCRVTATGPGGSTVANSVGHQSVAAPVVTSIDAPPGKYLWGAATKEENNNGNRHQGLLEWVQIAGVRPDIYHNFAGNRNWVGTFTAQELSDFAGSGPSDRIIPFWNIKIIEPSQTYATVRDGAVDSYLTTLGNNLGNFPHKVLISFQHEEDRYWPNAAGAQQYADMWRQCVDVVRARTDNVEFVWIQTFLGNHAGSNGALLNAAWPGDDHCDWIGVDLYYSTSSQTLVSHLHDTAQGTGGYAGAYPWATTPKTVGVNGLRYPFAGNKKIMHSEWGARYEVPACTDAVHATCIRSFNSGANSMPQIRAFVHFNSNANFESYLHQTDGPIVNGQPSWTAKPLSTAAFREVSADPKFVVNMANVP